MILAVVGPTGVGKTKMSLYLAKKYNAIIVNCDAVQVYKYLNIGSAKIKEEEKEEIPHLLFDIKNPSEDYSVKDYQDDLRNIINNTDNNIIIVGGTGLYLSAGILDYRFDDIKSINTYEDYSNEELYDMVLKIDSNTTIDKNNRIRLINYLNKDNHEIIDPVPLYDVKIIGLTTSRDNLYNIINKRVDEMFDEGLVEEVKELIAKFPNSRVLKTAIGYKEILDYLDGKISLDEAKELIKKNTRHYAKRQYTWFNNKLNVKWFNVDYEDFSNTINEVINYIEGEVNE